MINKMITKTTSTINKMADDRSEVVGYCRLLNNPKVKSEKLKDNILLPASFVADREVLVIQDTTELNYQNHINYLDLSDQELGPTGNNEDIGFFVHPGLVIDVSTGFVLGLSWLKIWNRPMDKLSKEQRKYKTQAIEEKESYRWIACAQESKKRLEQAKRITIVADRESDIYDEFILVPDTKTELIIRSAQDRIVNGGSDHLYSFLSKQRVLGQITIKIKKDQKKGQSMRKATLDIVATAVEISKPLTNVNKSLPASVNLYTIEAREKNPPAGQRAICWRLLTTYKVDSFEVAVQVLILYSMRWQIEIFFATLKTSGLDIESSQLETGKALKSLCVLSLYVSLKINQLKQAREDKSGASGYLVFSREEMIVLSALCKEYEGKTQKQKNHYPEGALAWAAWIIARIGGWKGYASEAKPGIKTMRDGLIAFYRIYEGYSLAKMCA